MRYSIATLLNVAIIFGLISGWIVDRRRMSRIKYGLERKSKDMAVKLEDQAFVIKTLEYQLELRSLEAFGLDTLEYDFEAAKDSLKEATRIDPGDDNNGP